MLAVWVVVLVLCVVGAAYSSRRAVTSALRISDALQVSPALVGLTVMAIGTDLPEIANSIVASAGGHGDVNVGDSMGSVVTQVTLVLGLLCLGGTALPIERNATISVGLAAVFASVVVWAFVGDGDLSHGDGLVLISLWVGGTILLGRREVTGQQLGSRTDRAVATDVVSTLFWLGAVGAFAVGVVESFLALAERFGVPELIGSFLALSIGTSLPELVVDWVAIRRGVAALAIGDVFGSSFVDATLSVGIGPALFGTEVSENVTGPVALAAIGVLAATLVATRRDRTSKVTGVVLLAVYVAVQGAAIVVT